MWLQVVDEEQSRREAAEAMILTLRAELAKAAQSVQEEQLALECEQYEALSAERDEAIKALDGARAANAAASLRTESAEIERDQLFHALQEARQQSVAQQPVPVQQRWLPVCIMIDGCWSL